MCTYKCFEDTSKPRKQRAVGTLICDDPKIPKIFDYSKRKPCFRKCKKTLDDTRLWKEQDVITDPFSRCSKAKCIENSQAAYSTMKDSCGLLKDPRVKLSCRVAAWAAYKASLVACDLCKKP